MKQKVPIGNTSDVFVDGKPMRALSMKKHGRVKYAGLEWRSMFHAYVASMLNEENCGDQARHLQYEIRSMTTAFNVEIWLKASGIKPFPAWEPLTVWLQLLIARTAIDPHLVRAIAETGDAHIYCYDYPEYGDALMKIRSQLV